MPKKKASKQSETVESYHDLFNDKKFNADEKIQQMKKVKNDQHRKKTQIVDVANNKSSQ